MHSQLNLKELEKQAFKSYYQDGLWDAYLGFLMMVVPLGGMLTDMGMSKAVSLTVYLAVVVCAVGAFILLKKNVTAPRLGQVRFSAERKTKQNRLRIILSISAAIGLLVFAVTVAAMNGTDSFWVSLIANKTVFGLFAFAKFVIVFSLIGYFMDFARAYAMGFLFGAGFAATIMADTAVFIQAAGLVFFLIGIGYFVRFLKNNPLPVLENGLR